MRKISFIFTLTLIITLSIVSISYSRVAYHKTELIGGGANALDNVDGAVLSGDDFAFVQLPGNIQYQYILDATSGAAEVAPFVISPDANAGTKRWRLLAPHVVYPDATLADQGAASGDGYRSVKDLIDAAGARQVTIKFTNSSAGSTTTYTFDTTEVFPITASVIVEQGAILADTSDESITFNGSFSAGPYKRFTWTGTGNVLFGNGQERYAEWWGALGDGATDDYDAFYAAGQAGSGIIRGLAKTYRIDTELLLGINVSIEGAGIGKTIFDFSNGALAGNGVIQSTGTTTELANLNANITKGTRTITLDDTPDVDEEAVIIVYDAADSSFSGYKTYYRAGEFAVVDHVSGNEITTVSGMFASYTDDANMHVYKITPTTAKFSGFSIKGPGAGAYVGLAISLGYECVVEDVESYDFQTTAFQFKRCFNCTAAKVNGRSVVNAATIGYNYGISITSCQGINITNSFFLADRHATTTGADNTLSVPNRNISFDNCRAFTTDRGSTRAMDMHGNIEYSTIKNCVTDSLCLGGNYCRAINNEIYATATVGMTLREPSGFSHEYSGNTIYGIVDSYFLSAFALANTTAGGTMIIKDNVAYMYNITGSRAPFQVGNSGSTQTDLRLDICDNTWSNVSGVAQGIGGVQTISGVYLESVKLNNNIFDVYGMQIAHAQTIEARGNDIRGGILGLDIYNNAPTADPSMITVEDNIIYASAGSGLKVLAGGAGNPANEVVIRNNTIRDNATAAGTNYELYVKYADNATIENNIISGSNANLNYLMYLHNIGVVNSWGNVYTTTKHIAWSLSNITSYRGQITLFIYDDSTFTLPTAVAGWGRVWGGGEMIIYQSTATAAVTSLLGTTLTSIADDDGFLCVFDAGATISVKNRLADHLTFHIEMYD